MKAQYNFAGATSGRFRQSVPHDAVFLRLSAAVGALFDTPGDLTARLAAASRRQAKPAPVRCLAVSPAQLARLKPMLKVLGAKVLKGPVKPAQRRAGSPRV